MTDHTRNAPKIALVTGARGHGGPCRHGRRRARLGQDKDLHYGRGVTVVEMRRASMALEERSRREPTEVQR